MKLLTAATLVLLSTGLASAAWTGQQFFDDYAERGYSQIEVKLGLSRAKVEATKDGQRVEAIHDRETGELLALDDHHGGFDHHRGRGHDDFGRYGDDDHDDRYDDDRYDDHGRHGPGHD